MHAENKREISQRDTRHIETEGILRNASRIYTEDLIKQLLQNIKKEANTLAIYQCQIYGKTAAVKLVYRPSANF